MQNSEEMVNTIGEEIRNILGQDVGSVNTPESCDIVKAKITHYLISIQSKLGYPKTPEVRVENEGYFITINFFDNKGNRLETLGDMLEFMENPHYKTTSRIEEDSDLGKLNKALDGKLLD